MIMWINRLFGDYPIDFEKRCRIRMAAGMGGILLGILSMVLGWLAQGGQFPVLYLERGTRSFLPQFYMSIGAGLACGGAISLFRSRRYLRDPELSKKRRVYESDERNRLLGLRCWAYTGYTMMLALYIGVLVSGFISVTVSKTLLAVTASFAVLLFVFRKIMERAM